MKEYDDNLIDVFEDASSGSKSGPQTMESRANENVPDLNPDHSADYLAATIDRVTQFDDENERARYFKRHNILDENTLVIASQEEEDVIDRADKLRNARLDWAMLMPPKKGDESGATKPVKCDENLRIALQALYYGKNSLYFDEFVGLPADAKGVALDRNYAFGRVLQALPHMGYAVGNSVTKISEVMVSIAGEKRRNSMTDKFLSKMPEWDGVERTSTFGIELFECEDSQLNRDVWRYYWLSLYNRIVRPGCNAPIVLALIGAQGCGKSYFYTKTVRHAMSDYSANYVPHSLGNDETRFLRSITGASVMCNISEMSGFGKADIEKIKSFVTQTDDSLDHKFMAPVQQQRQWIITMDSNTYEGFQRDSTGNRRFYPVFCGQTNEPEDAPAWNVNFRADLDKFDKDTFWQLMAECHSWVNEFGIVAYDKFVSKLMNDVSNFSTAQTKSNHGQVRNDAVIDSGMNAVWSCPKVFCAAQTTGKMAKSGYRRPASIAFSANHFRQLMMTNARGKTNVTIRAADNFAASLGMSERTQCFRLIAENDEDFTRIVGPDRGSFMAYQMVILTPDMTDAQIDAYRKEYGAKYLWESFPDEFINLLGKRPKECDKEELFSVQDQVVKALLRASKFEDNGRGGGF